MRRFLGYFIAAVAVFTMAISCKSSGKKVLPTISGQAGEVLVIIDQDLWEGSVGIALRDTLLSDCAFLPQKEALFKVVNIIPSNFTQIFKVHRNIIQVKVNGEYTSAAVTYHKDVWAAPQSVIDVTAPDKKSAEEVIRTNYSTIVAFLEQSEIDRVVSNAKKYEDKAVAPVVENMIGGSPHFPKGYQLKKITDDFIWITCDTQFTMQSVMIYKYPVVKDRNMLSESDLLEMNCKVLKDNVPGMFENSYMIPNLEIRPEVTYFKYKGRGIAEIRGLWDMENDYMGGPFVAHAFYNQDGSEVIVMEAVVYAPKHDKRQYLRQVEGILYSFEWAKKE